MTKSQEADFAMFLKIRNFYPLHKSEMQSLPILSEYYQIVYENVDKLIEADSGSRADLTGVTMQKGILRSGLQVTAQRISNAVGAFAAVNNDVILRKRIDYPASKWYSCSEEELITQASIALNLTEGIVASLAPYGVQQSDVETFKEELGNFVNYVSEPTLAIDIRKSDNIQVTNLIEETKGFLTEKLDVVMRIYEVDNPVLHKLYLSARAIDVNGPVTKPTAEVAVPPREMESVHETPYQADLRFTLVNAGNEAVFFSLSANDLEAGKIEVPLFPGETRTRLAKNLAPAGTFLMVRNPGEAAAQIKIWAE